MSELRVSVPYSLVGATSSAFIELSSCWGLQASWSQGNLKVQGSGFPGGKGLVHASSLDFTWGVLVSVGVRRL